MVQEFDVIIRMTAVRVGIDEEIVREIVMFHWKNIHRILSNCEYSKVRIKKFGNFEIRKTFLKRMFNKLKYIHMDDYTHISDSEKGKKIFTYQLEKEKEFLEIYKKYWKDEIKHSSDSPGMGVSLPR